MKVKNLNRSSEKTKSIIRAKFAELLKENRELDKVTVTELVKRADINRTTFYNHYDSIYDIAKEFEAEIVKALIEDNKPLNSLDDIYKYFDKIFDYLKFNEQTYHLLLSSSAPRSFLDKLNIIVYKKLYASLKNVSKNSSVEQLKFDVHFFTDGIINQVLRYFTGSTVFPLDDISGYAKRILKQFFAL